MASRLYFCDYFPGTSLEGRERPPMQVDRLKLSIDFEGATTRKVVYLKKKVRER